MFMGEFNHTIDAKSRLFLPAKYREMIGNNNIYFGKWPEGCLYIMTEEYWEDFVNRASETLPNTENLDTFRRLFGWTTSTSLDSQGRILISPGFMEFAGLTDKAVIVGCGKRAEIWSPERWQHFNDNYDNNKMIKVLTDNRL
ncbi:MAG: division/cell wall cluster transcriptional repressor MraZ [Clostridia bacterium]|nr:division/cell wall cluster transcriptional repressor MraZ [Clostridia bacterium]